jgi:hypothetical protein
MGVHLSEEEEGRRLNDATSFEKALVSLGRCIVSLPDVRQAELREGLGVRLPKTKKICHGQNLPPRYPLRRR